MNKMNFGIKEFVILIALLGMVVLLAVRFLKPELLNYSSIRNPISSFIFGCLSFYLMVDQYKVARSVDEWGPNRLAGIIRVPLYFAASIFMFYLAATGS
ncbi:hypothetical protein ACJJH9_15700 [Microbulbifer sp. DLAB2-AF]|uniref:hypothetical protein n=1 Tax=Microbulbifer sp. DLAB2-AF TaxID=3243395 RepID=UPI0040392B59